jgi:hypothetical protein
MGDLTAAAKTAAAILVYAWISPVIADWNMPVPFRSAIETLLSAGFSTAVVFVIAGRIFGPLSIEITWRRGYIYIDGPSADFQRSPSAGPFFLDAVARLRAKSLLAQFILWRLSSTAHLVVSPSNTAMTIRLDMPSSTPGSLAFADGGVSLGLPNPLAEGQISNVRLEFSPTSQASDLESSLDARLEGVGRLSRLAVRVSSPVNKIRIHQ